MAFFQNVFQFTFKQVMLQQAWDYSLSFSVGANQNNSNYMVCYNNGPWDLSGSDAEGNPLNILTFFIAPNERPEHFVPPSERAAIDYTLRVPFTQVDVDIAPYAADISAVTAEEVVAAINGSVGLDGGCVADPSNPYPRNTCSALYTAQVYSQNGGQNVRLIANSVSRFAFISNYGAESVMGWNKNAPVVELPDLALKYAIQNYSQYPDLGSTQRLLALDPSNAVDADVIEAAGLDPLNPTPDWKLMKGCSDLYRFSKTVVLSGTQYYTIEYFAGSQIGDPAVKTYYTTNAGVIIEKCITPYILTSSDLIVPF